MENHLTDTFTCTFIRGLDAPQSRLDPRGERGILGSVMIIPVHDDGTRKKVCQSTTNC